MTPGPDRKGRRLSCPSPMGGQGLTYHPEAGSAAPRGPDTAQPLPSAGCLPTSPDFSQASLDDPVHFFLSQFPFSFTVPAAPLPGWARGQVIL